MHTHRSIDPAAFAGAIQRPAPKTINTHLHLLEAAAAFHRALGPQKKAEGGGGVGDRVEELLRELLELVAARVIVGPQGQWVCVLVCDRLGFGGHVYI